MSRYTYKYDLYDDIFLTDRHDQGYFMRSKIYIGNNAKEPVRVKSMRDLMPYYNYVITSAGYGEDDATIFLTEKSWPDILAEEYGDPHGIYEAMKDRLKGDIKKYDTGELISGDLRS